MFPFFEFYSSNDGMILTKIKEYRRELFSRMFPMQKIFMSRRQHTIECDRNIPRVAISYFLKIIYIHRLLSLSLSLSLSFLQICDKYK